MRSTFSILRPSAGLVVAIVALFVALSGTGYAAATLSGKDIARNSIPGNRIVRDGLGGTQIKESKLGMVPSARRALSAQTAASATTAAAATTADSAQTAVNAQNAATAQDAQKLQGREAAAFMANSVRVETAQVTVASGNGGSIEVACRAEEKGIGGGAAWIQIGTDSPTQLNAPLTASMPVPATAGTDSMTGWKAAGRNETGSSRQLRVYAICVPKAA